MFMSVCCRLARTIIITLPQTNCHVHDLDIIKRFNPLSESFKCLAEQLVDGHSFNYW